jgi:hypothetical protein
LEFVNDRFAELFGVSQEEVCRSNFDPMTLIAPESRRFIRDQYREWCRGAYTTKQLNYTGLSSKGLKIECETLLLFIPYKWGVAIQGTLRSIHVSRQIDETLSRRLDLPVVLNAVPTGALYIDSDRPLIEANKPFCKSDGLPMEQIPRVNYPINPENGVAF